jgi:hypothetical protein
MRLLSTMAFMKSLSEQLKQFQRVVGADDTKAAATAGMSTSTFRRAKEGIAPLETQRAALAGLEKLRREALERLNSLECKSAV